MNKTFITLCIGLPALLFFAQIVAEIFLPQSTLEVMHSEWGPHETLQALLTAIGFVIALITATQILKRPQFRHQKPLFAYFCLATLCCLYVTGEEISWGQHIFDWGTPEYWNTINDQGETNLHNSSSFLDQKPRLLLLIGIAAGGLLLPMLRRFQINLKNDLLNTILPHGVLSVCAFFTVLMSVLDKVDENMDTVVLFERSSEVQEVFMFLFVLLYLISLRQKTLS